MGSVLGTSSPGTDLSMIVSTLKSCFSGGATGVGAGSVVPTGLAAGASAAGAGLGAAALMGGGAAGVASLESWRPASTMGAPANGHFEGLITTVPTSSAPLGGGSGETSRTAVLVD